MKGHASHEGAACVTALPGETADNTAGTSQGKKEAAGCPFDRTRCFISNSNLSKDLTL